jgi:DNA-directed RNA polymerase II subunit RPB2
MFNPVVIKSENDLDKKSGKYSLEINITFNNFVITRPQIHENNGATKRMFPNQARLRNFTYASAMTIDLNIKYIIRTGNNLDNCQTVMRSLEGIHIGKLPIMLKSCVCVLKQYNHVSNNVTGECAFDAGGYFIINGSEKTVLAQERAAENQVYCFENKKGGKWSWLCEIKSVPDFKQISPKQINIYISSRNNGFGNGLHIQIPRMKQPIPLFIVFRALGVLSDKEICSFILLNTEDKKLKKMLYALKGSIIDANKYITKEDAIKYVTNNVMYTPINMTPEQGKQKKIRICSRSFR